MFESVSQRFTTFQRCEYSSTTNMSYNSKTNQSVFGVLSYFSYEHIVATWVDINTYYGLIVSMPSIQEWPSGITTTYLKLMLLDSNGNYSSDCQEFGKFLTP
ncbi:hypothetical protein IFM89_012826 [Coptis chinensis]|uniref:Uncharacterized protein n=1 Tax=Coptis chinensis TaxID=261450 RepID=A0A835H2N5_9MAGN|nr:hypothetical protein IFM89_012826 [Coptis chinensis]